MCEGVKPHLSNNAVIHKSKLIREKIEYDNNHLLRYRKINIHYHFW